MKTIKNVLIKLDLEGSGIVNMDSNAQRWVLKNTHLRANHDNVSFAKKAFIKNENVEDKNDVDYKIKISDDCMLKSAFRYDKISLVPNIVHHDALLYAFIASPNSLITGYMYPESNIKRTGSLKLSSAIQTCNAMSALEVFSRSGEKMSNNGTSDESDTTFFYKETVGNIKYSAEGGIDLMSLQFVPCDTIFDRHQFNPDYFSFYKEFLKKKMPNFDSELGYFQLKNSSIEIPEYGILLSKENVIFLVKEALKRLLLIDIKRKGSFARVSSLKIKLVEDPLNDTFGNDNDWITIKNHADIDALDFDVNMFYEQIDIEKAKLFREDFETKVDEAKKKKAADKKEKVAEKKNNKEKKNE